MVGGHLVLDHNEHFFSLLDGSAPSGLTLGSLLRRIFHPRPRVRVRPTWAFFHFLGRLGRAMSQSDKRQERLESEKEGKEEEYAVISNFEESVAVT